MEVRNLLLPAVLALAACAASGQTSSPVHHVHRYTAYEQLVYARAMLFHKNFDDHAFKKNKALVAPDVHVNSNGTEFNGADEYVNRIARFIGPFPDVKIKDLSTVVDGNMAAVRFVITGTHKGDLKTSDGIVHATNKQIKVDGIEYMTFNPQGKLIDLVTIEDLAGLLRQLR